MKIINSEAAITRQTPGDFTEHFCKSKIRCLCEIMRWVEGFRGELGWELNGERFQLNLSILAYDKLRGMSTAAQNQSGALHKKRLIEWYEACDCNEC